jgi:uncharacterized membrane protein
MISVTLYSRTGCKLCEQTEADLKALQDFIPHKLSVIDIDSDPTLREMVALEIPVVEVGRFRLKAPFTRQELQKTLSDSRDQQVEFDRKQQNEVVVNTLHGKKQGDSDRFSVWFSRHYLGMINFLLLLYVGIPFLAPIFKKAGWNGPAEIVYKIYSPLCHQWAFRSFFLFGEQSYYPHAAAKVPGAITFEQASGISDANDPNRLQARNFEGTPLLGYKVAFCERDVAIWGAMALFGLVYAATGRRLPKMHWAVWILVGLVPIGLDGFSQLLSQIPIAFIQAILPYRESTPFLRTLTGFLFGFSTAWFMFPIIEESMAETRRLSSPKFTHRISN